MEISEKVFFGPPAWWLKKAYFQGTDEFLNKFDESVATIDAAAHGVGSMSILHSGYEKHLRHNYWEYLVDHNAVVCELCSFTERIAFSKMSTQFIMALTFDGDMSHANCLIPIYGTPMLHP